MNKIGFLFGAGISIPAGLLSTQDITDNIISGNNVMHHSDDISILEAQISSHGSS